MWSLKGSKRSADDHLDVSRKVKLARFDTPGIQILLNTSRQPVIQQADRVISKQEVALNNFDIPGNVSKIVVNENDVSKEVSQFEENCSDNSQILNTYIP